LGAIIKREVQQVANIFWNVSQQRTPGSDCYNRNQIISTAADTNLNFIN
jgi:hypothetical protein